MKKIISRNNLKILKEKDNNQNARCNCRVRERSPLKGNCLMDNVKYKDTIKNKIIMIIIITMKGFTSMILN